MLGLLNPGLSLRFNHWAEISERLRRSFEEFATEREDRDAACFRRRYVVEDVQNLFKLIGREDGDC